MVEATNSATEKLNEVLDTDAGSRYVGEFAIGFNPYVTKPMKDILFDEKIAGSIHFTPGRVLRRGEQRQQEQDSLGHGDAPRTRPSAAARSGSTGS